MTEHGTFAERKAAQNKGEHGLKIITDTMLDDMNDGAVIELGSFNGKQVGGRLYGWLIVRDSQGDGCPDHEQWAHIRREHAVELRDALDVFITRCDEIDARPDWPGMKP